MTSFGRVLAVGLALGTWPCARLAGQEVEIVRPAPAPLEDFETDANKDGIPDGWYNARDAKLVAEGGPVGAHCLRFECRKPGRPARLSRAFGVDGRKHEAVVLGLWVRLNECGAGERMGDNPGLMIDFLGEGLRQVSRGLLGPWNPKVGPRWTRVAKRIPVPPGTRDAIMSVGLIGATGVLEIDGLTIDLVPIGGFETTNLVRNGDFELGDPDPAGWLVEAGARRSSPGARSDSALELSRSGARALTGLAVPIEPFPRLSFRLAVKAHGLRGAGGASATVFFLDDDGRIVPDPSGNSKLFQWGGSFDWQTVQASVLVPPGAIRAVFQFDKADNTGTIAFDNLAVTAGPNADAGSWLPDHVADDVSDWQPFSPSPKIEPQSALDASFLLDAPAGRHGFVTVKEGRLAFTKGDRARFHGVALIAPSAFLDAEHAEALADRLARSGVNLVRLGDLDTPHGPQRSLFDDTRDDTKVLDPVALDRLDHLIATLKSKGIYVAIELQGARRFRDEDGVAGVGLLPPGGGPAAAFDPVIAQRSIETARALLGHVNPETGLPLRNDPVLAWVTLAGELTLFDLIEDPTLLPGDYATELKALAAKSTAGSGRRFWMATEETRWKEMADALRADKLHAPIAGVSHWRRDPVEFVNAQAAPGLDLIDDRLFWSPPLWGAPARRSMLWGLDGSLLALSAKKRKHDRPYVVGEWCPNTQGAWALPLEAADVLLAARTAASEDWDALVRRGYFVHPDVWGADAAGTGGTEDIFQVPEVVNGIPQVFSLWPHVASILLRGHPEPRKDAEARQGPNRKPRGIDGWDPARGKLVIETPYTQGLAGWTNGEAANFEHLAFETESPFAVVVASSATKEPIARSKRLLVTALARVEPTGFRWADEWRRDVADPGRPPLVQEPVVAKVRWLRKGPIKGYALDNTGARVGPATLEPVADGVQLSISGTTPTVHWELVVE